MEKEKLNENLRVKFHPLIYGCGGPNEIIFDEDESEEFTDSKSSWEYHHGASPSVQKERELVKTCLECPPKMLVSLKKNYREGGIIFGRDIFESGVILPNLNSIKAYSVKFSFELDKNKKAQIKKWILSQRYSSLKNLESLERNLGETQENLKFFRGQIKGRKRVYMFYNFTLCKNHQREIKKTLPKLKRAIFGHPPNKWGFQLDKQKGRGEYLYLSDEEWESIKNVGIRLFILMASYILFIEKTSLLKKQHPRS